MATFWQGSHLAAETLVSISLHVGHPREGWDSVALIFTNSIDQDVAAVEDMQQPLTIALDQGHI